MTTHEYASCEDYSSRSLRIRRSLSSGIMTCCIRRRSRGIRVVAAVGILVKVAEHIVSGEWGETLATSSLRSTHELRRKLFGGRAAQIVAICAIMSWKNGDPTGRLPEEWGSHTTSIRMGIPHDDSKVCAPMSFVSQQKTRGMDEFNPLELGLAFIFSLLLVFSILCYFK